MVQPCAAMMRVRLKFNPNDMKGGYTTKKQFSYYLFIHNIASFIVDKMQIETIQEGDGIKPLKGQNMTVHYTGWLKSNGEKFDSSRDRDGPFHFTVGEGQVIRGWDKLLLQTMSLGSRVKATIPPVRS